MRKGSSLVRHAFLLLTILAVLCIWPSHCGSGFFKAMRNAETSFYSDMEQKDVAEFYAACEGMFSRKNAMAASGFRK